MKMKTVKLSPVRKLANRIARKLFTPGGPGSLQRAQQLRLMRDGEYICGWGEEPMAGKIAEMLEQARVEIRPLKPKRRRSK